jgi:hypothetical protein
MRQDSSYKIGEKKVVTFKNKIKITISVCVELPAGPGTMASE